MYAEATAATQKITAIHARPARWLLPHSVLATPEPPAGIPCQAMPPQNDSTSDPKITSHLGRLDMMGP